MLCDGWLGGYRGCGGGSLTLLIKEGGGSHVSKFQEESESREIYHLTFFSRLGDLVGVSIVFLKNSINPLYPLCCYSSSKN